MSSLLLYCAALKELPFLNLGENRTYLPSNSHDSVSGLVNIPRGFPFGNSVHNTVYVRINLMRLIQLFHS